MILVSNSKSNFLTMIPKICFAENVTCSLFCGSASHMFVFIIQVLCSKELVKNLLLRI